MKTKKTNQGWDLAAYRCGRCGCAFASGTAREHTARVQLHLSIHHVADTLIPLAGIEEHEALDVAVTMARAMTAGAPRHIRERLDVATQLPAQTR